MKVIGIGLIWALVLTACVGGAEEDITPSGVIKEGVRVVTLDPAETGIKLYFYRGDYVRFLVKGQGSAEMRIPAMDVEMEIPMVDPDLPYLKFKEAGTYPFFLKGKKGTILVVEYIRENYTELTPGEAVEVLKDKKPLILDVRTAGEYKRGHLEDAHLLPVQELQRRLGELETYKNTPVFIYCATGNRSTVAAKILQDNGFQEIYNLRSGISGWGRSGYKIVK